MISIRFTKSGVVGITKRELQAVGRVAIAASAKYWWEKFLPIHFTKAATRKYKYRIRGGELTLRKGSYSWAKLHRKTANGVKASGEVKPFVWSGRSRESAETTEHIRATAKNFSTYTGTAAINAPAINFVKQGYDELTRTTQAEDATLARVFLKEYERQLNLRGRTRTVTIAA